MRDEDKTKEQLIDELAELRRRNAELEAHTDTTDRRRTEEELRKYRDHLEDLVQERTEQLQQEATRRRQAEEELREREARYRDIIALSGGVVYEHGARGSYYFMDEGIKRLIGYTPREMTRELFDSLIEESVRYPSRDTPIDDTIDLRPHEEKVMTYEADCRVRVADGRTVWLADFSIDIRDSNDEILRSIGILQDITERKQTEEALRESEQEYRNLFDNMLDGFAYCEMLFDEDNAPVDFVYLRINDAFAELTGLKRKNVIGKRVTEAIPGIKESHPELFGIYGKVALTGEPAQLEIYFEPLEIWLTISVYCPRKGYFTAVFENITKRRQAEEALRESEQEKAVILGSMSEFVVYYDTNMRILWANKAATERIRTLEPVTGQFCYEIWHRRDEPCVGCPVVKTLETGQPQSGEIETPDEGVMLIRGNPIRDADGDMVGIVEVALNITERKQAEEDLRKSTQLLETIFDHTHMLVAYMDPQFNFIRVNHAYAEADERESSFFPGKNHFNLYPNAENEVIFRRVVETGEPYSSYAKPFEYVEHPERGISYWDWNLVQIKASDGAAHGLILALINVTERIQATEALHESEENFKALAENANDGIVIATASRDSAHVNFAYANRRYAEITGYSVGELIGRSIWDVVSDDEVEGLMERVQKRFEGMEEPTQYETVIIRKDGKRVSVEVTIALTIWQGQPASMSIVRDITERKQAEEALRESEAKWKAMSENSPAHVTLLDRDANILFTNRMVFDLSREEVVGTSVYDYIPSDSHEVASNSLASVWLTGEPTSYTTEYLTGAGEVRYFDVWLGPVFQSGKVIALVSSSIDITDRKRMANAVQYERDILQSVMNGATNSHLVYLDRDFNFVRVNEAYAATCGYRPEEMIGKNHFALYPHAENEAIFAQVRDTGEPFEVHDKPFEFPDQSERGITYWDWTLTSIKDSTGYVTGLIFSLFETTARKQAEEKIRELAKFPSENPNPVLRIARDGTILYANEASLGLLSVWGCQVNQRLPGQWRELILDVLSSGSSKDAEVECEDRILSLTFAPVMDAGYVNVYGLNISERKRAEEALRKSEGKYRTYVENAPHGIFIADANGRYVGVNQTACLMTGYSREELLNMSIPELVSPASPSRTLGAFNELKETGRVQTEVILRRKDGTDFHSSLEAVALSDDSFMAFCLDITNRRRMEEELLKVQKLESIGILAGGIAHDLNNLLTGVMGNISLAQMYKDPAEKDRTLAEALKVSMRIKDLTKQLLTFSRGGAPILQTTDIAGLLRESAAFALRGSNVRCEYSIPGDLQPVEVDEGQINQVISNLVINAKQAMPDGGVVRISAENMAIDAGSGLPLKPGVYIKVSVEDEGIGISEEHIHRVFDPFFTTKQAGSGLGLATSYSIIRKHDGHITVESQLGVGTTFHIYSPVSPEGVLVAEEKTEEQPIIGEGRILVMDDEQIVRQLASDMLTNLGYEVSMSIDGAEAIELYKRAMTSGKPFHAVIIDLTIPGGMGGKETIQKLIEIDPQVKAIVSSGYSNDPIMAEFRRYGFKGVIAKPYETKQLSEVLHRVITNTDRGL